MKRKIWTSVMACAMVLSLAACGNKSASESHHDDASGGSSQVTKKHHSKKTSSKSSSNNSSSTSNSSNNEINSGDDIEVTSNSSSSKTTINSVKNSSTASSVSNRETPVMSATDARNLVKEHLSNSRATALENGQSEPTQPSTNSIDDFSAVQNDTNDWTISGNYNGKAYTYHVTPNAIN